MMEKYTGVDDELLLFGLRDEEAQLMQVVSYHMGRLDQTAAEQAELAQTQSRLQHVRAKITELDLKRTTGN